jgi:hypothetical protein
MFLPAVGFEIDRLGLRRDAIVLDWGVAAVVISVSLLLGFTAAVVPAMWAARVSVASLISGIAVRGGAASGRTRRSLIVVQVALSLVLLSARLAFNPTGA